MTTSNKSILIVAGEISGDMHAAQVVRSMRAAHPEFEFFGVGGDALRAEGVEILYDVKEMAVLGLSEVLKRYFFFRRVFKHMLQVARERRPDAVLLVDYPGFNLRYAKRIHASGLKVFYYICPQVWAWHRSRIDLIARIVDRLIVIFPFEVDVFGRTDLRVDFVGHPLVDASKAALAAPTVQLPWESEQRVALLPGSRKQEVARILPEMWHAAGMLEGRVPDASFLIAAPSEQIAAAARHCIAGLNHGPSKCSIVVDQTREVLRQARAAMVASGTATVQTALMGCPMIVVYKTAALTYHVGRRVVKIPHIGMVNVIADRMVCPEFIQGAATPDALATAIHPLIEDSPEREQMIADLQEVSEKLGTGGAGEKAAHVIVEALAD